MFIGRRLWSAAVVLSFTVASGSAQSVTSAHSGTLHYFQGDISLNGEPLQWKVSKFPEIKDSMILRSGLGRAEVLLTPGVFLRMGENSAIRMLDTRLASTRVELLSGTIAVESDDPRMSVKNAPVTLVSADREVRMVKNGLIELGVAELRVFKGEAQVAASGQNLTVKDGHMLAFGESVTDTKFDTKSADDLYLWARDRSQQLSAASMASARSVSKSDGGWVYNSGFGMFTLVPSGGTYWSPFGNGFFSPGSINDYYAPGAYWYGGGTRGASGGGQVLTSQGPTTRLSSPVADMRGSQNQAPLEGSPMRGGLGLGSGGGSAGNGPTGGFGGAVSAGPTGGIGAGAGGGASSGIAHGGPRGR